MTSVVLDASALLALLNEEPGADVVRAALGEAIISAVNYSEVLKKTIERGGAIPRVIAIVRDLSVPIIPFDEVQAGTCAELYPQAKPHGMSMADRACLALGIQRKSEVLTTERRMGLLSLPIKVKLIRNSH